MTRKFSGKNKDFWTRQFLAEQKNSNFIQVLLSCWFKEMMPYLFADLIAPKEHDKESGAALLRPDTFYRRSSTRKQINLHHLPEHSFGI